MAQKHTEECARSLEKYEQLHDHVSERCSGSHQQMQKRYDELERLHEATKEQHAEHVRETQNRHESLHGNNDNLQSLQQQLLAEVEKLRACMTAETSSRVTSQNVMEEALARER